MNIMEQESAVFAALDRYNPIPISATREFAELGFVTDDGYRIIVTSHRLVGGMTIVVEDAGGAQRTSTPIEPDNPTHVAQVVEFLIVLYSKGA